MSDLDPLERKRRLALGLRRYHGQKWIPWLTERLSRHLEHPAESLVFLDLQTTDTLWAACEDALDDARAGRLAAIRLYDRVDRAENLQEAFSALRERTAGEPLVLFYDGVFESTGAAEVLGGEIFAHPLDIVHERGAELFAVMVPDASCGAIFDYNDDEYFEGRYQATYDLFVWGERWVSCV